MTRPPIRATVTGRDEPVDLPADTEVGQIFLIDGVDHVVEEVELWIDPDHLNVVRGTASLRPGRDTFPFQPTRARTLDEGPCVV